MLEVHDHVKAAYQYSRVNIIPHHSQVVIIYDS